MVRFNIPPLLTRSLILCLLAFTTLNSILRPSPSALAFFVRTGLGSPLLSLVPGESFKYPWTLVSATFVEQNIFGLIVTSLTLFFGGRYLERAWGTKEFALFIFIICLIPNILCFSTYIFFYQATRSARALTTTVSGGIAIQSAFLVAFKQLVPEHTVSLMRGIIRMRVKHFPAIFLAANTISGIILGTETAMFLSWLAFFTSWTYLRFYRKSPLMVTGTSEEAINTRGDASDTFAFAYFFPEPLQTPLAAVSDHVHHFLVQLHVCTPFSDADVSIGNEQAMARSDGNVLPRTIRGGQREEADRRRAIALKALDQRLNFSTSKPGAATSVVLQIPPESSSESANHPEAV